jgi:predicted short-subunit dehydrogenase-like oxidoreductase (DUF2520 family)
MIRATIIGAGSVGISISKRFSQVQDLDYELLYRSQKSYDNALASGIPKEKLCTLGSAQFDGNFLIICVTDSEIVPLVNSLTTASYPQLSGKIAFHTSGTLSKECLTPLKQNGLQIAAAHPFQTFANTSPNNLDSVPWGIDADTETFQRLEPLIEKLGGRAIRLSEQTLQHKSLYHISAIAASNFMALSIEFAKSIAEETGIDPSQFLPRIMETTLQNNINQLGSDLPAITGPIVRGETDTIALHLETLGTAAKAEIYKNLCRALTLLAKEKNIISLEKSEQFLAILGK